VRAQQAQAAAHAVKPAFAAWLHGARNRHGQGRTQP
jgi:hypothetical protein